MKRTRWLLTGVLLAGLTGLGGCGPLPPPGAIFVEVGPPPPPVEVVPVSPGPEFVWVAGFYAWEGGAYAWRPGRWVERPEPRARWVPGRWMKHGRGNGRGEWYWMDGHWDH